MAVEEAVRGTENANKKGTCKYSYSDEEILRITARTEHSVT